MPLQIDLLTRWQEFFNDQWDKLYQEELEKGLRDAPDMETVDGTEIVDLRVKTLVSNNPDKPKPIIKFNVELRDEVGKPWIEFFYIPYNKNVVFSTNFPSFPINTEWFARLVIYLHDFFVGINTHIDEVIQK